MSYKNITILNSANMPTDGTYIKKSISKNQFIDIIQNAENIISGVGYESVKELIKDITGVDINVERGMVHARNDNTIVGLTIGYRIDPKHKGYTNPTSDDYIYFIAEYNV